MSRRVYHSPGARARRLKTREEVRDVAGEPFGLLDPGEVPAARHRGPPAHAIHSLGPLAGRHSLVDELAGEDGDPGRSRTERWRSRSTFPDPRLGNLSPSREVIHDQDQLEAALAHDPDVSRWNGKSLSSGQLAKIYGFTDLDGSQPDAWRYVTEVQDAGKPADVTGYR